MFLKRKGSLLIISKEKAVPEPVCWAVCFFYTSTALPTYKHCASYRQAVCLLGIGVLSRVWRRWRCPFDVFVALYLPL